MNTLDYSSLFQFGLRHATNAIGAEIGVARLNASKTAQVLVTGFLPFCDEIGIGNFLGNAIVIKFATDRLSTEIQVVDVAGLLVMDFEYWP